MQRSDLQILTILAEEENMRRAAERLFVSQPALSQRLQGIEEDWGTTIFVRSKRGLSLTASGEKIVAFAKETLSREEQVREEIVSNETNIYGTLKLAVATITGQYWLPRVLKKFVEKYPLVKISLVTGWSSEILRHMYEGCHIGIIRGNPKWRGRKQHLFSDTLNLVDTSLSSIKELRKSEKAYIQFRSDSSYYQEIQEWWHQHSLKPPERTIYVDQIETCKQMAINGIGYAILPSMSLTEKDNVYKMPLKDKHGRLLTRETWLLSSDEALKHKQVKAFVDLLSDA
ncbi:DNA-binding transcriptional LysR family regulator [Scopulibacillus daqui]|uniref:DNA-binding transcriptional LysR family regulator n=1 Tax=Scopulibacillus daqui TaxID=1469162 RepID=A0ABS2Q0F7_9BACL|nr:LysR family transcriptional regulator [Scopulibacillus daqui]MBM7645701.1 DNA-binding transcriptional LysR family regulator [Scopulibacillus daqui]